jgi:2-polyprenyl-3-methyl-5-hydroxy-6-metoxy-1,4-benzoquinol methylase
LLACPDCRGAIDLERIEAIDQDRVETATLICKGCRHAVPIIHGIPRFVSSDNYAAQFGFQWAQHPLLQYDSYNGLNVSEARFFGQTGWPRSLAGETVLEVGCGAGRFTEQVSATGATVVSVDYSDAVDVNYAHHRDRANVLIVQADVYRMPFAPGAFDRAFCFGVIQHTPDPRATVMALAMCVRPGGDLAIDVYLKYSGPKAWIDTKYWVRPLTRRIPPRLLYRLVNAYVRAMWPIARVINLVPYIGIRVNWKLLIADRRGMFLLPDGLLREWAVLDTFDMLGAVYDAPQFPETIGAWLRDAGMIDVEITTQNALVVARARSALAAEPSLHTAAIGWG